MTPEDKTSLTVLRDGFLKGQYKPEIAKLIRLERQDAIEKMVDSNAREYSAESIQQHNEWMNERAKFHEIMEKVRKELDYLKVNSAQYDAAVAELRTDRDAQRLRAVNALHDAALRTEERDDLARKLEGATADRDAKESIMADCGLLLCEHFGDRSFWPREELPAGIHSLIEQVAEESEDAAKARAELAAGTKLMHEQQRQHDDYKNAAAALRTKLEAAETELAELRR